MSVFLLHVTEQMSIYSFNTCVGIIYQLYISKEMKDSEWLFFL